MTGPSTPGATAAGVEERRTRDARKASSELVGCWTRFHAGRVLFLVPASLRTAGGLRTAGHMLPALRALLPGAQYLRFAGLRSRTGGLSAASSGGTMATVLQPANGLLPVTAHLHTGLGAPGAWGQRIATPRLGVLGGDRTTVSNLYRRVPAPSGRAPERQILQPKHQAPNRSARVARQGHIWSPPESMLPTQAIPDDRRQTPAPALRALKQDRGHYPARHVKTL